MKLLSRFARLCARLGAFYRRPVRVVGTVALLAMPMACAYCVENTIHPSAQENTAFCSQYLSENKLNEAEARAKLALEYSPKYAEAWNCRGLVEYHRGHLELAVEYFKRAISFKRDFAEAYNNLGAIWLNDRREYVKAEEQFRSALEVDPGFVNSRVNLGLALLYQQRYEEAKDQYMRCLELQPDACDCRMGMGYVSLNQKDWSDARAHFERLVQICPDDADAYYHLGLAQYQLSRCQDAYNAFVSALVLSPGHLEAKKNLMAATECIGRQDAAVERLMSKIRDNPGDAELHFKLGTLWDEKRQYDNAKSEYLNVARLQPNYKVVYYRLARLFDRSLQKDETIAYCQKFVDVLRDEPLAAEKEWCISRVRELQYGQP